MKPIEDASIYGAWLQAAEYLLTIKNVSEYNLILEIESPFEFSDEDKLVRETVNTFLVSHGKQPLDTVADTIFPLGLYQRFGADGVYTKYPDVVYPNILKKTGHDWGRYAYRLVRVQDGDKGKGILLDSKTGDPINPLKTLVTKLKNYENNPKKAAYEASLIDPIQDIPIYRPSHDRGFTMGGPCLSHLSFKVTNEKTLSLTAFYRNHFYVERTLGNLLGLSWLLYFVSKETGIPAGSLTCISSMAQLEKGKKWSQVDVNNMIHKCRKAWNAKSSGVQTEWTRSVVKDSVAVALKN